MPNGHSPPRKGTKYGIEVWREMQLQFEGKWSRQYCMCGGGGEIGHPALLEWRGVGGAMLVLNIDLDNNCIVRVFPARLLHQSDTVFYFLFLIIKTLTFESVKSSCFRVVFSCPLIQVIDLTRQRFQLSWYILLQQRFT